MNARRYPRTLQEAFGPYATSDSLVVERDRLCFFRPIVSLLASIFRRIT